ncbi:MAG: PKD domain-containing protein [candidate division WOR-3 bacterium]|jgi:hypothetical protein|nr:PKD domain-containing protein [candidate division WOR-3 bacterium]
MNKPLALFCLTLLIVNCVTNQPPTAPEISGPTTARPGDTVTFTFVATDPEGSEVSYKIVWGDTSSIDWTPFYASGQPVRRQHIYPDTGTYTIKAIARDQKLKESPWSESLIVNIRLLPPGVPEKPAGPAFCTTGVTYQYRFRASHPQNDSLWYQIDWGGKVDDWRGPIPSDTYLLVNHTFDTAGIYAIAVRARDSRMQMTNWSDTLLVTVVAIPGGPPTNFTIEAASDTTVRLSWQPPVEGVPNFYRLQFKEIGGTGWSTVVETSGLSVEHNPHGLTGMYKIAAVFGATVYEDTIPLSTVPVPTGNVTVGELSGPDKPGYGWNRLTGIGKAFLMNDTIYCDSIDWFCTDFATGSNGPFYYVVSPHIAPYDTSGNVPPGPWRQTALALLADEQGPVPPAGDTSYHNIIRLTTAPVSFAIRTEDDYYAIVKVNQIRISNKDIRAQAWFQPINGLRLLRH